MLSHKKIQRWTASRLDNVACMSLSTCTQAMLKLSKDYNERVQEEEGKTAEELIVAHVGKVDPKRHLQNDVADLMASNIVQCLGSMLDTIVF